MIKKVISSNWCKHSHGFTGTGYFIEGKLSFIHRGEDKFHHGSSIDERDFLDEEEEDY